MTDREELLELRVAELEEALKDALVLCGDIVQYKLDFLCKKHGDHEEIARLRKILEAKV